MNIQEAIRYLKMGKKIKCKDWDSINAIDHNEYEDYDIIFTIGDVLANDWEVAEEKS